MRALRIAAAFLALALSLPGFTRAAVAEVAIVADDLTALRPAPRESAKPHTLLWQGESLEIRGERLGYLQVYNHRIERGGFVSAKLVRRVKLSPDAAPELLAVLRFLGDAPGREALGIGYAAAYLQAASADTLRGPEGAEALELLGTFAERLARRASSGAVQGQAAQSALGGHLEVAAHYGVVFKPFDRDGRIVLCYEGDAFRRVMARDTTENAARRARAALALTRVECSPGDSQPLERRAAEEDRARLLESVKLEDVPPELRNRVHMRRASLWNTLAFRLARRGENARAEAMRAQDEIARVDKSELTDDDRRTYADAATRVNATRWAAEPAVARSSADELRVTVAAGKDGETCVMLVDAKHDATKPLARRCTYAIVWEASAKLNRERSALALAVQHTDTWREMWVFRKTREGWVVRALPPAPTAPGVGYAELAGWVPGGKQLLVAREAIGDGKHQRNYEILRVDTLTSVGQATDPTLLPAFQRWQDPAWVQASLSLR
jgi:hypothetical protein